jgi:CHASE2 domain-containing sensor protein
VAGSDNRIVLNPFLGAPHSYPSASFVDVLSMSRVELMANFAGKYILIGESGTLIHDSLISPVTGTLMDGVELHAHYLDGLLQNQMLTRMGSNTSFAVTI